MKVNIIITICTFIVVTLIMFLLNNRKANFILKKKSKRKNKKYEIMEVKFLSLSYGLKEEKLLSKKILFIISLLDAFIISVVFLVIVSIPLKIAWQLLIGFALLMGLIYSLYSIFGKILLKMGYDK